MKRFTYMAAALVIILCAAASLSAQQPSSGKMAVATTSWTAAFVRAAGFTGTVHVLAPAALQHPPEYELKPSDIQAAASADYIVFAGYERFAAQLKEAAAKKSVAMVQIATDYSLETLRISTDRLSSVLGTGAAGEAGIREFETFYETFKDELRKNGTYGAAVICHALQAAFLKELGFSIKGVYGPAPLEPAQLKTLNGLNPSIIIDNWHNQIAKPLKDIYPKTPVAVLINFPGRDGTITLIDVLAYNKKELLKVLGK